MVPQPKVCCKWHRQARDDPIRLCACTVGRESSSPGTAPFEQVPCLDNDRMFLPEFAAPARLNSAVSFNTDRWLFGTIGIDPNGQDASP